MLDTAATLGDIGKEDGLTEFEISNWQVDQGDLTFA